MSEKKETKRKSPWTEKDLELLEKLRKIRNAKESEFKPLPPTKHLRQEVVNLEGELVPFRLRYYQVQGIVNLVSVKRMILGDGTGLGKCVTPDTLLITDRGMLEISQLSPAGTLTSDTFYELPYPVRVWTGSEMVSAKRFFWNGEAETLRVQTRNGYQVEGSLRHPILVRSDGREDFKRLPDVEIGTDYACIERRATPKSFPQREPTISPPAGLDRNAKVYTYPETLNPDLARLLGYVVAEAWTNDRYHVNISQHADVNPEVHSDIRRLMLAVFGWEGNQTNQERDVLVSVTSVGIRKYLESCGVGYLTAHDKVVPWCVLQGTRDSVREFLRGLFEGEGSVADGGVEISSSSESLLRVVQVLLLRFGIVSCRAPKPVEGRDHTYWRLTFFGEDARTFAQEIGFISSRKIQALQESFSETLNPNKDVIPYLGATVEALKLSLLEAATVRGPNSSRKGSGLKQFGESFQSTLKHVICGRRNASLRFVRQLLEASDSYGLSDHPAYQELLSIASRRFYYDPIVSVEGGHGPLMDIEVDHPSHSFVGNGLVNHNTVQTIGALCYLFEKNPAAKVVVIAPKSAIRQWASELARFTTGIEVFLASADGFKGESVLDTRTRIYKSWVEAKGPSVLIMNYAILTRDWNHGGYQPLKPNGKPDPKQPVIPGLLDKTFKEQGANLIVVFDEATGFKSRQTKTWEVAAYLSQYASRVYALTATLLKNNLMEGFNILKAIYPQVFRTQTEFYEDYCYIEMKRVAKGQKIPVVLGYKNLDKFREAIELVYLGRPKHLVSNELPTLTTREVTCELNAAERVKYAEALSGLLELGDGELKDFSETKALTSLIYCQQVVNSLSLLKFKEGSVISEWDNPEGTAVGALSSKEQALLDLLQEELEDDKVIVYTRFASHVPRLMEILKKNKIVSVCITGAEGDKQRKKAQDEFQNLKSKTRVIFITSAGSEAINLQAAAGMVFYDMPWSWGDYVQTIGRMIRIGSPHKGVLCFHILAELPGVGKERKTIDHHVLSFLRKKKNLIDKVLGEAAVGALKFEKDGASVRDLIKVMRGQHAT